MHLIYLASKGTQQRHPHTWHELPRQGWSNAATRTGRETDQTVFAKYARSAQRGTVAAPGAPARRAPAFTWPYGAA
jgi:hypothetical protein